MSTSKNIARGGGGSLATIAIGLYASGWPENIRSHPHIVVGVAVTAIVAMLYGFIPERKAAKAEPDVLKNKVSFVAGDNPGRMIQAENYFEASPAPPPVQPTPAAPAAKTPIPTLLLEFSGGAVEVLDWNVQFVDSGGKRCHSIRVHNKEADAGEEAHRADAITARLTFRSKGSTKTISIDRACWIGSMENEVYLQPGDTKHILLGILERNEWITYHNPNQRASEWPAPSSTLAEVKFSLLGREEIAGEISIISHRNNKSLTLARRAFIATVSENNVFLHIRWENEA